MNKAIFKHENGEIFINFQEVVNRKGFDGIRRFVSNEVRSNDIFDAEPGSSIFIRDYLEKILVSLYISAKTFLPVELDTSDPIIQILEKQKFLERCEENNNHQKSAFRYFDPAKRLYDLFDAFIDYV